MSLPSIVRTDTIEEMVGKTNSMIESLNDTNANNGILTKNVEDVNTAIEGVHNIIKDLNNKDTAQDKLVNEIQSVISMGGMV